MHSTLISQELQLLPFQQGIKLTRPEDNERASVSEMVKMPFNVFFIDTQHHIMEVNDPCLANCGFYSKKDAIGATIAILDIDNATIERVHSINSRVMQSNSAMIVDETAYYNDGSVIETISFKFPWYGNDNNIIGVLGCALDVKKISTREMAKSIDFIHQYLLGNNITHKEQRDCPYVFSSREIDVINSIVRGKTLREVAEKFGLSPRTVESYFEAIKAKVGVTTKSQLLDKLFEYFC